MADGSVSAFAVMPLLPGKSFSVKVIHSVADTKYRLLLMLQEYPCLQEVGNTDIAVAHADPKSYPQGSRYLSIGYCWLVRLADGGGVTVIAG
jgi:hypothetical protein